ncbi:MULTISPECIES: hypothetical protein, partial [Frankia]
PLTGATRRALIADLALRS